MSSEAKPAAGATAEGKPSKFSPKLIMGAAMALVNFAVVGGGAFVVFKDTMGHEAPVLREPAAMEELKKEKENSGKEGAQAMTFTLPKFTANLSGNPQRIIRMEMTLEMLDQEGFEEVVRLGPEARDSIMRIINTKQFQDVETIQGKLFLKDQIAVTLNQFLKTGAVKDIYFSDFVVQ